MSASGLSAALRHRILVLLLSPRATAQSPAVENLFASVGCGPGLRAAGRTDRGGLGVAS